MNVSNLLTQAYCGLATHHSDRGVDIREWPLMARAGYCISVVLIGLMPGLLGYAVITPSSVVGWLFTGIIAVLGILIWFDHGKLQFPRPVRAAIWILVYSWFGLALLLLIWPISADDVISVSLGVTVIAIFFIVSGGIPTWAWRGAAVPAWVGAINRVIKRPLTGPIRSLFGPTVGETLAVLLIIVGFWSWVLVSRMLEST